MQMYQAAPGMWLCVGVTIEEHRQAMAANYEPGRDEYLAKQLDELFREETRLARDQHLLDQDRSNTWTTRDGRRLAIKDMSDEHVKNTVFFLQRAGVDVDRIVPNLVHVYQSRFKEAT